MPCRSSFNASRARPRVISREVNRMPSDPEPLLSAETIAARVRELRQHIQRDYSGVDELAVVWVLTGCFMFASDLVRAITLPLSVDFLGVRSYGDATTTSGVVRLTHDLTRSIADKHVLLVED